MHWNFDLDANALAEEASQLLAHSAPAADHVARRMLLPAGFNWFLILATVVVAAMSLAGCIYLLVEYQHPEDRNQAWIPKIIVILSMSMAIWTVLAFPLDVANQRACSENISPSSCTYTLPMHDIWFALFISNLVFVFAIIPFTLFLYEADSDL
jgi:LMBR1 domain-containing protein 1